MRKRPRGRPTKQTTTLLMDALTQRQIALAEQRAREINRILATHVTAVDAAKRWVRIVERTRRQMLKVVPARVAQALPQHAALPGVVRDLVEQALEEFVVTEEDRRLAARPSPPPEPRATVPVPQNLAHARGIAAGLAARLMRLRARIIRPERGR
jgi:hypothetical protein